MIKQEELTNPHSCMSKAADREMTFVLLARDVAAPFTIRTWVTERIRLGKNSADDPQILEALHCAAFMEHSGESLNKQDDAEIAKMLEDLRRPSAPDDLESHSPSTPSFWVIERFENERSKGYWTGESSRDFTDDIDTAIHFSRKDDARIIRRGWHWKDVQVTEHVYLAAHSSSAPEGTTQS